MSWPFGNLKMFGYEVLVADPPWLFDLYSEEGEQKSAQAQYECMPLEKIMALPVDLLARDNALLLLLAPGWAVATCQAHRVAKAWKFEPITMFNWRRVTRLGKVRMGTGYRVRTTDEQVMLCTMGNPRHKPFRSFDGVAREHSRKPVELYDQIRRCCPDTFRADLFSRETRDGFDGWGIEHGKFDPGYVAPVIDDTEEFVIAPAPLFDMLEAA